MIKLTQSDIVHLFVEKVKSMKTKSQKGTYDTADPTSYENTHADMWLEYGYSFEKIDKLLPEAEQPIVEMISVAVLDCTWGVQFEFKTSIGFIDGYWQHSIGAFGGEGGSWCRCHEKFERVFYDLLMSGEATDRSKEENVPDNLER